MAKTILIVEDEQVLRQTLATLLTDEGYDVLQAANGREGHDVALANRIDLVITDVRMPEMDGMTLLGHLRQLMPETPVIMLTAYGTVQTAIDALRAGAVDYILKPVQFDDLLLRVRRDLDYCEMSEQRRAQTEQAAAESSFHSLVGRSIWLFTTKLKKAGMWRREILSCNWVLLPAIFVRQ